jgi:hypothetical protein
VINTIGIVSSDAVRKIVKSEEIVYTNPESRWNRDMRVTRGPHRQKFSFIEVCTVPIVYIEVVVSVKLGDLTEEWELTQRVRCLMCPPNDSGTVPYWRGSWT